MKRLIRVSPEKMMEFLMMPGFLAGGTKGCPSGAGEGWFSSVTRRFCAWGELGSSQRFVVI
jgi:hypothetical protein